MMEEELGLATKPTQGTRWRPTFTFTCHLNVVMYRVATTQPSSLAGVGVIAWGLCSRPRGDRRPASGDRRPV